MTTTFSQTVFSPWLTPVRLASVSNIAGTYNNGPSNNGVGATLTIAASSLTIDSVVCAVGDRVLLQTQTNTYEQGIYVVRSIASTVVLERSEDQQSLGQLKAGEYVAVGAGSVQAGTFFTLIEPLPQFIGVNAIVFSTAAVRMKAVAGAAAAGGAAAQSFTDAFCTSGSNVIGNWNTQTNAVSVFKIVPGNGSFVVTSSGDAGVGTFNYIITK